MKLLKLLLYTILITGTIFLGLGIFAKKNYHIERSITVDAPRSMVYEYLHKFGNFWEWSPWHNLDADMKASIEGTDGTVGARYTWAGNKALGKGSQTITGLQPDRIDMQVEFTETVKQPMPVTFRLEELEPYRTKIHWMMDMRIDFPWNAAAMFTDVPAALGKDLVRGLERLETVLEEKAFVRYRGMEAKTMDFPAQTYVALRQMIDTSAVDTFLSEGRALLHDWMAKDGMTSTNPAAGLFWSWANGKADAASALVLTNPPKVPKPFTLVNVGGKALVIEVYGTPDKTADAHIAMDAFMADQGWVNVPPVMEIYTTTPATEPDTAKWLTKVVYFVAKKQ